MRYVVNLNTPKELINEYEQAMQNQQHVDNSLDRLTLAEKTFDNNIIITVSLINIFDAFVRISLHDTKHNRYVEKDIHSLISPTTMTYKDDIYEININQGEQNMTQLPDLEPTELIKVPQQEVMDKAIEIYGKEYQIDRFLEECNELCKALLKRRRTDLPEERFNTTKINNNVQEEIGDVLITLAQVIKIHGNPELIKSSMAMKVNRLKNQLIKDGHLKP